MDGKKPMDTVTGHFLETGIKSTSGDRSKVAVRVDMTGNEVGLVTDSEAIYINVKDLPVLIARLRETETALRAEHLL